MSAQFHKKALVLAVCFLQFSQGAMFYWANVSVYVSSYNVSWLNGSGFQTPWMYSVFNFFFMSSTMACSVFAKFFSRPRTILVSVVIENTAILLTYFAIQRSMSFAIVTFGVINGVAAGHIFGNSLHLVLQSADGDVGLLSSIVQVSMEAGASVMTQIVTWYVNPLNQTPDLTIRSRTFFTQKDVVDRVPSLFLVLGACSVLTQTIGLICMQFNPSSALFERIQVSKEDDQLVPGGKRHVNTNGISEKTPRCINTIPALKSPIFYSLFVSFLLFQFPLMMYSNYYKIFGQVWIRDDHFLTNLATAITILGLPLKMAFGFCADKLGVKFCFVFLMSLLVLSCSWIYFTPMTNRWLYTIVVLVFGGAVAGLYTCYLAATSILLPKANVSTNFGMLATSAILLSLFAPEAIKELLVNFGWFMTFAATGGITIFNLIACVVLIPKR